MTAFTSWNRYPQATPAALLRPADRSVALPLAANANGVLAFGNGRSYSDVCLNDGGTLIHTRGLDRFVAFDAATGVLRVEAGMLLDEILAFAVPRGWFLPVVPGTRFVTVGGAIANDVHGKNHHEAGTFGCHVAGLELLRGDGERAWCSPAQNAARFAATIGGLGLTGLITVAEIRLRRIVSPAFDVVNRRFANLDEFFALDAELKQRHAYTVAWIDCLARGATLGRGLYSAGDHAAPAAPECAAPRRSLGVPLTLPLSPLNRLSLAAFNALYFRRGRPPRQRVHYQPWLFPLDAIGQWHRLYGRRGFVQFQCAVPQAAARSAVTAMLQRIAASGDGSPLAVLKSFGAIRSPGLLSFPLEGVTLALDFPLRGARTLTLCTELYRIAQAHGGRVYPAKDSTSPPGALADGYAAFAEFTQHIDPAFSSGYLRRQRARGQA